MNSPSINRRDFMKLVGITSLSVLGSSVSPIAQKLFNLSGENTPSRPNILMVVFDALSARNMSLYGYSRANTPNLERYANRMLVFHQHHASGNFTSPGTASLLLGVYPWKHRSLQHGSQIIERYADQNLFSLLPQDYFRFAYSQNPFAFALMDQFRKYIDLLPKIGDLAEYNALFAEKYLQNDYYIATVAEEVTLKQETHLPASLFLSLLDEWRLRRDNARLDEAYKKTYPLGLVKCRAENPETQCFLLEKAIDWTIAQVRSAPRPFFGYIHYLPPHAPYNPRADFMRLFNDDLRLPDTPTFPGASYTNNKALKRHRRRYDQFIAHADSEFGRLMDSLEEEGLLDHSMVIFTSDHGELLERGILGHDTPALYEPIIHIPLLISLPGQKTRVDIETPTNAVDIVQTLLALLGEVIPVDVEGSALPLDGSQPKVRSSYSVEAKSASKRGPLTPASFAVQHWPYKLTKYSGYGSIPDFHEFYDLEADPEELNNLYSPDHTTVKVLEDELKQRLSEVQ